MYVDLLCSMSFSMRVFSDIIIYRLVLWNVVNISIMTLSVVDLYVISVILWYESQYHYLSVSEHKG